MGTDRSDFAKKTDLASLTSKKDKIYVNELEAVTVDLIKLSDIVKNIVGGKIVYYELLKKVYTIDTIDTKVPNNELVTKDYMIQTHKILKERSKILTERYVMLINLLI